MKKSLIALAALAAVGAASAQSSVTLYGVVDIGYGTRTVENAAGANLSKVTGVNESNNASNRIGFRGTEDLGGGLKANFVIEQGISPTNPELFASRVSGAGQQVTGIAGSGLGTSTNRQAYAGVSSSIGTFNIGRQYSIANDLSSISGYNAGMENIPGHSAHVAGYTGATTTRGNLIMYISPAFAGGFVARASYGAGDGRETVETATVNTGTGTTIFKQRTMALGLKYSNGPLSAAGTYSTARNEAGNNGAPKAATTNVFGASSGGTGGALLGQSRTGRLFQLGGSYDFGVAKLSGTYANGRDGGSETSTNSTKTRAVQVGVTVPFGNIVPFATVGSIKADTDNVGKVVDVRQYQVGARYNLSKRSTFYGALGQSKDSAATGATAAAKDRVFVVGVSHAF